MARRRGPSTPPYGRGPPPYGFAAGRIWMAAPHPKADVARSLRPRPLIGFDDPPDDRVADDVGARELADVDLLQPHQPPDRVGGDSGRGDRPVDLRGVAEDTHVGCHARTGYEHIPPRQTGK